MSRNSVFCIAPSRGRADRIVHGLKEAEFPSTDISVVFLDQEAGAGREASPAKGAIRGVLGWIAGARRMAIPGIDSLIAAGPVAAALGGATVRGVAGGLIEFGLPPAEAGGYEGRIKGGAFLIAVQSENPDRCDRAREIFTAEGAEDLCTQIEISTPMPARRNTYGMFRGTAV